MIYKGVIFTKHILHRIKQRGISHEYVYWVWRKPDQLRQSKATESTIFKRKLNDYWFYVVGKKNAQSQWVLLTCWSRAIVKARQGSKKVSFWKNLWRMLVR